MFTDFLYLLRAYGMKTGLNEWNSLMEALQMNLNHSSLTEFYYMARTVLVKKETDYDKFDQAFSEYFKNLPDYGGVSDELLSWLDTVMPKTNPDKERADSMWENMSLEEIEALMKQRMREQTEAHNGGSKWIGTGGITAFGHSGYAPKGIRISGEGRNRKALKIAAAREYRDFRDDKVLEIRQFQMAFRKLRVLSGKDEGPKTELNVDKTIEKTCKNGGNLEIVMERPRKNQTKLLLLIDSGGSMWPYADLCNKLFQAVNQASKLKDLKVYYFHNCIYGELFMKPGCMWRDRISTDWVMSNIKREYKVILVGDATMGPAELLYRGGTVDYMHPNDKPGIQWLEEIRKRYPASVWMNPLHEKLWNGDYYTSRTVEMVKNVFPMFPLTVKGLEAAVRELLKESL